MDEPSPPTDAVHVRSEAADPRCARRGTPDAQQVGRHGIYQQHPAVFIHQQQALIEVVHDAGGAVALGHPIGATGAIITTKAGAAIDSKEVYVDATFALTNPAAATPLANLSGKIRGRGNVTWLQPKKPYKVQFTSDAAVTAPGFTVANGNGMKG